MRYRIHRECWNENTYNGYTDSPYWRITFENYEIGLKDNGIYWSIKNDMTSKTDYVREKLETIIKECKLKIKLK